MFKKLVFMLTILSANAINAQNDEQLDKMTASTCDCAEKKDFKNSDAESYQMELGVCIISALEVLPEKERKKINFTDSEGMRQLGEKIGMRMATKCPKILMMITKLELDRQKKEESIVPPQIPDNVDIVSPSSSLKIKGTISGTIKEVKESDFLTIVLIDNSQKEYRFIWLGHFEGESDFMGNPQSLKGKKVDIGYYENEKYVPQMKEYVSFKQIAELKVK
jgi:hypothetical protein